jgi:hypothetical protein
MIAYVASLTGHSAIRVAAVAIHATTRLANVADLAGVALVLDDDEVGIGFQVDAQQIRAHVLAGAHHGTKVGVSGHRKIGNLTDAIAAIVRGAGVAVGTRPAAMIAEQCAVGEIQLWTSRSE